MNDFYLTPLTGSILVFLVVVCGHRFRKAWKEQYPGWQKRAWMYGVPALIGLLMLGFVPLEF
ncbi:hypothetical protein [Shimia thalassica]|uniref:hypothetical protein n=1 Tax=Shimia thalassica TaxID=1715693 RepID=UPI00249576B9|nr:hypothetical protein [Shimia thalassica]